jgi:hypothetical protein
MRLKTSGPGKRRPTLAAHLASWGGRPLLCVFDRPKTIALAWIIAWPGHAFVDGRFWFRCHFHLRVLAHLLAISGKHDMKFEAWYENRCV